MRCIKVVAKESIEEILDNPADFVDETSDMVLIEIRYVSCSIVIMLGKNENDGRYYLTAEDDEVAQDYYLIGEETLADKFNWLVENITEEGPFPAEEREE